MTDAETKQSNERFKPDEVIASQRNRQLMVVTVIILVLAGLIAVTRLATGEVQRLSEVPVFGEEPGFEPADVHRVLIRQGGGDPLELRRDGDGWVLPGTFNHPADNSAADSLVQRPFDATRFNRPVTTDADSYIRYRLDDEDGAHLILMNKNGDTLAHLMVGSSETGTRDFIRYVGDDAPEGVFELGGVGGHFRTLYSALLLSADGEPQTKSWLDLARFRPLPRDADVRELQVRDGDRTLEFRRREGSEGDDEEWEMTAPGVGEADAVRVQGAIDALQNLRARDVAGTRDVNSSGTVESRREAAVSYLRGDETVTVSIHFGDEDDNRVAVRMQRQGDADTGQFVYWADADRMSSIFRPVPDYMKRERLAFLPTDLDVEAIEITDPEGTTRLVRKDTGSVQDWSMTAPFARPADSSRVQGLLRGLDGLRGYSEVDADREALGLIDAPRRIAIRVPGEEGESLTKSLAFGNAGDGVVAVLLTSGDREEILRIAEDTVDALFRPAVEYLEYASVNLLPADARLGSIHIHDGENVTTLEQHEGEEDTTVWTMTSPQELEASYNAAMGLLRTLNGLKGSPQVGEVDRGALNLGKGLSERRIVVGWPGEGAEDVNTATLYFGNPVGDEVPVLLEGHGREEIYWLPWYEMVRLFQPHVAYLPLPERYEARVVHVLVSWQGKHWQVTPKDSTRTEREAWKLAEKVREEARDGADFEKLQEQYSEEGAGSMVFEISEESGEVEPFKRLSITLQPGEVDFVESQFGIHIIKRIE